MKIGEKKRAKKEDISRKSEIEASTQSNQSEYFV